MSCAAARPTIDLRFFRSAPFTQARPVIAVGAFAALGGFLFLNTLYLPDVRGSSAFPRQAVHVPADGRDDGDLLRRCPAR